MTTSFLYIESFHRSPKIFKISHAWTSSTVKDSLEFFLSLSTHTVSHQIPDSSIKIGLNFDYFYNDHSLNLTITTMGLSHHSLSPTFIQ